MSEVRSRPATDAYREGWDRIFQRRPARPAYDPHARPLRVCKYPGCVLEEHGYDVGHWIVL